MSGRGVLFALGPKDQAALQAAAQEGEAAVVAFIHEDVEERWERDWLFETDKAWAAIHCCLTDGRLLYENGKPPLNLVILGGYQLTEGDNEVVSVTASEDLPAVAAALEGVTEAWFREQYFKIDQDDYPTPLSEEDFDYTWSSFQGLPEFYRRAAEAGDRAVVFTVDF